MLLNYFFGQLDHVIAMVAIWRHSCFFAQALLVTSMQGTAEVGYLGAHVIYVVFFFHSTARGSKHISQSAAQDSTTAMTYVERPGGIDTNKFHLDSLTFAHLNISVRF